ncbi:MAG: hypothetical protein K2J29_00785, partial [Muribaculaceae bacterium]|nr:hypothetical protein [Muribaculaceae bacterium]
SISRCFCLTADKPAIAWQYLKGIVTPGVCCEYEIPVCFLKKSCGKYAGRITETEKGTQIESVFKDEWCTVMLRPEWLREVIPLETFVPDYELATARWFEANKDKIKYRIGL